jgi:hypothetical protein
MLLLVLAVLALGAGIFALSRRPRAERGTISDAESEARRWVDRLAAGVTSLDGGTVIAARQALADASERYTAASSQLATARSPQQFAFVRQTALEGLYYIRAARIALDLDPGPELPAAPIAQDATITIDGREYVSSSSPGQGTPYYYPGGTIGGRPIPTGWYAQPWWRTAVVAGAAGMGGMLLADILFGGQHHGGPGFGGWGGGPGFGGGFGGGGFGF